MKYVWKTGKLGISFKAVDDKIVVRRVDHNICDGKVQLHDRLVRVNDFQVNQDTSYKEAIEFIKAQTLPVCFEFQSATMDSSSKAVPLEETLLQGLTTTKDSNIAAPNNFSNGATASNLNIANGSNGAIALSVASIESRTAAASIESRTTIDSNDAKNSRTNIDTNTAISVESSAAENIDTNDDTEEALMEVDVESVKDLNADTARRVAASSWLKEEDGTSGGAVNAVDLCGDRGQEMLERLDSLLVTSVDGDTSCVDMKGSGSLNGIENKDAGEVEMMEGGKSNSMPGVKKSRDGEHRRPKSEGELAHVGEMEKIIASSKTFEQPDHVDAGHGHRNPNEYDIIWKDGKLGVSLTDVLNMPLVNVVMIRESCTQMVKGDYLVSINSKLTHELGFKKSMALLHDAPKPVHLVFMRTKRSMERREHMKALKQSKRGADGDVRRISVEWQKGIPLGIAMKCNRKKQVFIDRLTNKGLSKQLEHTKNALCVGNVLISVADIETSSLGFEQTVHFLQAVQRPVTLIFEQKINLKKTLARSGSSYSDIDDASYKDDASYNDDSVQSSKHTKEISIHRGTSANYIHQPNESTETSVSASGTIQVVWKNGPLGMTFTLDPEQPVGEQVKVSRVTGKGNSPGISKLDTGCILASVNNFRTKDFDCEAIVNMLKTMAKPIVLHFEKAKE